jgi:hypothetical protein
MRKPGAPGVESFGLPILLAPFMFAQRLSEWLKAQADAKERLAGRAAANNPRALRELAAHIDSRDEDRDREIVALAYVDEGLRQVRISEGAEPGGQDYRPGPQQARLLQIVGDPLNPTPTPDVLLRELVCAGVYDLKVAVSLSDKRQREEILAARKERDTAQAEVDRLGVLVADFEGSTEKIAALEGRLAEADQGLAEQAEMFEIRDERRRERLETGIYQEPSGQILAFRPKSAGGPKFEKADDLADARRIRAEMTIEFEEEADDGDFEAALETQESAAGVS